MESLNKKTEQAIFWDSLFRGVGHRMVRGEQKEGRGKRRSESKLRGPLSCTKSRQWSFLRKGMTSRQLSRVNPNKEVRGAYSEY